MPRIATRRTKMAPEGFAKIEPTLQDFEKRLQDIQSTGDSKVGVKGSENLWKIMQVHHERSRYVYMLFYKRKLISRELYLWLLREKYADKQLIAKWRKKGYEKLCCLRCIQSGESNNGTTCICRVPRAQLERDAEKKGMEVTFKQCIHCGCNGCASTD
ncbi:similar to Saccharomyces cerevisiae YCR063W BUD31 Component of the SF3b subcomplex of the U2 snRNP [Maudiozyma barnettii]|uniref:Similar to Saccharomyces cerevisiae YCR063W BUD31 Component of the SF3b subcomplex of the U2 snRNP n=1 Tax=Maudiozyma barnettii TaxID=61262 RepID=A0A8H2VFW3_9SACH|nr:U2 snRNP complex subunit BUD31 [Kazachstania barnettii]CAB4254761.1 similar to Saccharomyces cerevisiae YCR063W BUD31 Component of the SF3b subcomplex of the U2 snRNP [Kazachstania barnettii]CAD1782885.1 similar to Saccharomyces cerevisiae YCR063W BUD31 Component of the SF3b subcomplex of the U2 snRNP [Kazachstania barnettii]